MLMACLLFLSSCLFISKLRLLAIEFVPFVLSSLLICILYFSALIDILSPITHALYLSALLIFVFVFLDFLNSPSNFLERHFTVGFSVFSLLLFILTFKLQSTYLGVWDEFSHWGVVSKSIFMSDTLPSSSGAVQLLDYPPGTALFHYLFYKFSGGFSEHVAYLSQDILLLSLLPILLYRLQSVNWKKVLLTLLIFSLCVISQNQLQLLYVDALVTTFFAGGLILYFSLPRKTSSLFWVLPSLIALPIIKSPGKLLVIIQCSFIFASFIYHSYQSKTAKLKTAILTCLMISAAIFGSIASWHQHIAQHHLHQSFKINYSVPQIRKSLNSSTATKHEMQIRHDFEHKLRHQTINNLLHLTPLLWVIILLITPVLVNFIHGYLYKLKWDYIPIQFCCLLGFIIYTLGLLIMYFYSFSPYEGSHLASFGRYLSIYLFAWSLILYGHYLTNHHKSALP